MGVLTFRLKTSEDSELRGAAYNAFYGIWTQNDTLQVVERFKCAYRAEDDGLEVSGWG